MPLNDAQLTERFNAKKSPTSIVFNAEVLETRISDGWVRISFDVGPQFCNPRGHIQGGIVTTLLDEACAFAALVKAGKPIYVASFELKTSFLAPALQGRVTVEAQCIKMGRSASFLEAQAIGVDGKVVAKFSTTVATMDQDGKARLTEVKHQ